MPVGTVGIDQAAEETGLRCSGLTGGGCLRGRKTGAKEDEGKKGGYRTQESQGDREGLARLSVH